MQLVEDSLMQYSGILEAWLDLLFCVVEIARFTRSINEAAVRKNLKKKQRLGLRFQDDKI